MTTTTPTLADFLLARLDEDEAAARAVPPLEHNYDMGGRRQDERFTFGRTLPSSADGMGNWSPHRDDPATAVHYSRHDPARTLRQVEAMRKVVEDFEALRADYQATHSEATWARRLQALVSVAHLAAIYSNHPDYDESWRP